MHYRRKRQLIRDVIVAVLSICLGLCVLWIAGVIG